METSYDVNEPLNNSFPQRILNAVEAKAIWFGKFIYSDGKVMGRTAASWGKIGLFYLIYYSCLAAFFAITMAVFYTTVEDDYPKLQGKNSLLKGNPGLGFRPMPGVSTTLIKFIKGEPWSYQQHVDRLAAFLSYYDRKNQTGDGFMNCDDIKTLRPKDEWRKSCMFDPSNFGPKNPCKESNDYGFHDGQPCILLKLNKIYAWVPKPYVNGTDRIPPAISSAYDPNSVTVHCSGEFPADKDNIGPVSFYPPGGFPYKYYPYLNQKGYRQPLVFAHFENITNGVVVMVNCQAYAKNIHHNRRKLAGSIHFEILVD